MKIQLKCQCGECLEFNGDNVPHEALELFAKTHQERGHRVMHINSSDPDGRRQVSHASPPVTHNDPVMS